MFIISVNVLFLSNSQQRLYLIHLRTGVYHKCQCPLFKQFTTIPLPLYLNLRVFIISVNVLFLSNSQRKSDSTFNHQGVYHKCQCPLFKQFTTKASLGRKVLRVFIISVNVLFLSNSQLKTNSSIFSTGVYHKCQCPLFKQFTTQSTGGTCSAWVFIISVNVLFLCNSQRLPDVPARSSGCLS